LHQISIYSFRMDGKKTKGAVLQQAVESYCRKNGCGNPEDSAWEVRKTDKGKPFFVNQPGRYLSVTDSGRTRMIALGDCPVGIDLQLPETRGGKNRTREEQCLVLAGRWFHPEESCWIAGAADFQTENGRCARKSLQQINSGTDIFSDVTGRFFSGVDGQGGLCQVHRIGDRQGFFPLFRNGSRIPGSFILVCRSGGGQGGKRKKRPALRLHRGDGRNPHAENLEDITFHNSPTAVLRFDPVLENAGTFFNRKSS